ncbi:MAG: hypothetical protein HY941_12890 [Gammaproteobacteria bacterium]|nr:hypothetical protein [Gammaproteobacteria bacterium]
MSSNAYAAALRLELKPSRLRRYWRWLTHLIAIATVPMLQSFWLIAIVLTVVLLSLYRSRGAAEITLLWHSDGHWSLFENDSEIDAILAEGAFIQPWLVILPLRLDNRHRVRHIAIFPDMLPAQDFRRLRVRLRNANTP